MRHRKANTRSRPTSSTVPEHLTPNTQHRQPNSPSPLLTLLDELKKDPDTIRLSEAEAKLR